LPSTLKSGAQTCRRTGLFEPGISAGLELTVFDVDHLAEQAGLELTVLDVERLAERAATDLCECQQIVYELMSLLARDSEAHAAVRKAWDALFSAEQIFTRGDSNV
jgi:hypothetical protein